jgi:hypothetical protein
METVRREITPEYSLLVSAIKKQKNSPSILILLNAWVI